MSNLCDYARSELNAWFDADPLSKQMAENVLELLEVFSNQGHTGFTAPILLKTFYRLAFWKPIGPLTGEDDEWVEVQEGIYQNKRFSAVFKDKDNNAYNVMGRVFSDDNGKSWISNKHSRIPITFPYEVPDEPIKMMINKKEDDNERNEKPED